jgi:microcystin-dependent protein
MDYYIGEIRLFCGLFRDGGYNVKDWAVCDGTELSINSFRALYGVIGTAFNVPTTPQDRFRLPDMRGAVPIGAGQAPGLSAYKLGATGGANSYTLPLPAHSHVMQGTSDAAGASKPDGNLTAEIGSRGTGAKYSNVAPDSILNGATISTTGQTTPAAIDNTQPFLVVNYLICYNGQG